MRIYSRLALIFLSLLILSSSSFAIKLENLNLVSNFHVGTILYGPGMGINIGISAKIPYIKGLESFGLEVEQLMLDVNYQEMINTSRFGGLYSYKINNSFSSNAHIGLFNFQPSTDIQYIDFYGNTYLLSGSSNYKGYYLGLSLDYYYSLWDITISPKYLLNYITDRGTIQELDLNFSKIF